MAEVKANGLEAIEKALSECTVLELAELTKKLEQAWGVSAAAVAVAAPAAGGESAAAAEEKTEFDVVLEDAGAKKMGVIKVVRQITGLGLKEAKEMTEKGGVLKEGVAKDEANEMKKNLEKEGAKVALK